MKRLVQIALLASFAVGALALAGCSAGSQEAGKESKIWGYVASADNARIEAPADQLGTSELVVTRVVSPEDAWLVVHNEVDGMPGDRVGLAAIKKGESVDVKVPLEGVTSPKVIVAVHADKGKAGEFDFDMMKKEMSPDRPYFVDGKELATVVAVRDFGVEADASEAALELVDQPGASSSIAVKRVLAPADAWVVVHKNNNGMPGERVGLLPVKAGESRDVSVTLEGSDLGDSLLVAVHADQGIPGTFEFDMGNKVGSPDQPYFVDGKELAGAVAIK